MGCIGLKIRNILLARYAFQFIPCLFLCSSEIEITVCMDDQRAIMSIYRCVVYTSWLVTPGISQLFFKTDSGMGETQL